MQKGYYLQPEVLCYTKSIFHAIPAFLLSLNGLPIEVLESPSLEVLGTWCSSGLGSVRFMTGLDALFQHKRFYDFMYLDKPLQSKYGLG